MSQTHIIVATKDQFLAQNNNVWNYNNKNSKQLINKGLVRFLEPARSVTLWTLKRKKISHE
jgi:hypothetical protein